MLGRVGDDAFRAGNDYYGSGYGTGISPAWYALRNDKVGRHATNAYGTAFWAGLTGDITAVAPFRLAWSANYGSFDSGVQALNRHGWYASLLATSWTGARRAFTAGISAATTAIPATVPSACRLLTTITKALAVVFQ